MDNKTHSIYYKIYDCVEELPTDLKNLMEKAQKAKKNAYMPYSNFAVGASVLLDNGEIVSGNNQENVAFPSGICAERVAAYYAMAKYPDAKIVKIAITGSDINTPKTNPVTPCGACRQAILEYETSKKQNIQVACMGENGKIIVVDSIKDLLPFSFNSLN